MRIDLIGMNSLHATAVERIADTEDVRIHLAFASTVREQVEIVMWEVESLLCCGPAGGGGSSSGKSPMHEPATRATCPTHRSGSSTHGTTARSKTQLTADRVKQAFPDLIRGKVVRYEMDHLQGLNFVMEDAIEGGVNSSLTLDSHGKSWSFLLLALDIEVA